jgi:hypothetical protein
MSKADAIMKQFGMLSEDGSPKPPSTAPELLEISSAQREALIEHSTGKKKEVIKEDDEYARLKAANPKQPGEDGMSYVLRLNKLRRPDAQSKPAPSLQDKNPDELDRDPKLKTKVDKMTAKVKPASTAASRAAQRPEDLKTNEDTAVGSIGMNFAGKDSEEDEGMNAGRETTYAKPKEATKKKKEKKTLNREAFELFVDSVFKNIK